MRLINRQISALMVLSQLTSLILTARVNKHLLGVYYRYLKLLTSLS